MSDIFIYFRIFLQDKYYISCKVYKYKVIENKCKNIKIDKNVKQSNIIIIIIKEFTKFTGNAMSLRTANLSCFIRLKI